MKCKINDFNEPLEDALEELRSNEQQYNLLMSNTYILKNLKVDRFGEVFVEFILDLYTDYSRLGKQHFPFDEALAAVLHLYRKKLESEHV